MQQPRQVFWRSAAQRFESISLLIDLGCSTDAAAPKKRDREDTSLAVHAAIGKPSPPPGVPVALQPIPAAAVQRAAAQSLLGDPAGAFLPRLSAAYEPRLSITGMRCAANEMP
jgi:hypothetical protein